MTQDLPWVTLGKTEFLRCSWKSFLRVVIILSVLVIQSCPTLGNPMDCNPPGSSVYGILQARIREWVAIPFSRGSFQPRDQTQVSSVADRFFTVWATREGPIPLYPFAIILLYISIYLYSWDGLCLYGGNTIQLGTTANVLKSAVVGVSTKKVSKGYRPELLSTSTLESHMWNTSPQATSAPRRAWMAPECAMYLIKAFFFFSN